MKGAEEEGMRGSRVCDPRGKGPGFAASKSCGVVFRLSPVCRKEDPRPEGSSGWELFLGKGYISPIILGLPQAKPLDWGLSRTRVVLSV